MSDQGLAGVSPNERALKDEVARLNRMLQALMDRAERSSSSQGSDYGRFQATIMLEERVRARTAELEAALAENEKINRTLRESELKFRGVVSQSFVGIAITTDGRFSYCNDKFADIFGYTAAEIRQLGPLDVVVEADRPLVSEKIRQRMSGEVEQVSYRFHGLHKSGASIDIEIHAGVTNMNGKRVLISILMDVTERVRAEQKSREQETLFRGLVENGVSGIFMVNVDGTIAYANPRFAELLGNVSSELIGRPILDFVAAADQQKVRTSMEAMFSGRLSTNQIAVTVQQKGGDTLDTIGQGSLTTFQGKPSIVVVVLDVTELKRSEARIAELNAQMATTLAVLQRHLRDQTEIAQLSDLLQSCAATAEAYPIIGASAEVLFPQASGALAQVQTGTRELTRMAAWGTDQTILPEFVVDDCWALRTGQRREVEGPEGAVRCRHFSRTPAGPYICLPLTVQGETRGSLHFCFGEGGTIDNEFRQAMQSFGDVVKLSLANITLREVARPPGLARPADRPVQPAVSSGNSSA